MNKKIMGNTMFQ